MRSIDVNQHRFNFGVEFDIQKLLFLIYIHYKEIRIDFLLLLNRMTSPREKKATS